MKLGPGDSTPAKTFINSYISCVMNVCQIIADARAQDTARRIKKSSQKSLRKSLIRLKILKQTKAKAMAQPPQMTPCFKSGNAQFSWIGVIEGWWLTYQKYVRVDSCMTLSVPCCQHDLGIASQNRTSNSKAEEQSWESGGSYLFTLLCLSPPFSKATECDMYTTKWISEISTVNETANTIVGWQLH